MKRIFALLLTILGLGACDTGKALKAPCDGYGGQGVSFSAGNCNRTQFPN